MGRRKVFIQELNTFGEEVDVILTVSDIDGFLKVWDIQSLERILAHQVEKENYSMVAIVQKHIDIKRWENLKHSEEKSSGDELQSKDEK